MGLALCWARPIALLMAVSAALVAVVWTTQSGQLPFASDADGYWHAAVRIRANGVLYVPVQDWFVTGVNPYHYAPWFAWLWVPLTYLDQHLAYGVWLSIVWAAAAYATARSGLGAIVLAPALFMGAWTGNVAPLMAAGLFHIHGRWGPGIVAICASLKVAPILFVLPWIRARNWRSVLLTVAVTLLLWMPVAAYDLSGYPMRAGDQFGLFTFGPAPWLVVSTLVIAAAVVGSRSRYRWLLSGLAAMVVGGRVLGYDLAYLLPAIANDGESARGVRDAPVESPTIR